MYRRRGPEAENREDLMTTPEPRPIEDPGWNRLFRPEFRILIPIYGLWKFLHEKPDGTDGLTALRGLFVGLVSALFLFLFALSFIAPWNGGKAGLVPWLVVLLGVVGLWRARAARNRPLRIESLENLAVSYRANFFLGIGAAEAPALFAVVGVLFLAAKLWIYVEGLAFAVVGLGLIAPTRADIERRQRQIQAKGSALSLLEALIAPPSRGQGKGSSGP
jgi:hypothetical protein